MNLIQSSPEVDAALRQRGPVVALESTVIAHGLPSPRNLQVAGEMEAAVRREGAVPATIAVLDGLARAGLSTEGLQRLARSPSVLKLSTRDLPVALAGGREGATTVAATLCIASRLGIQTFATGGIGGVHRGDAHDVSADLTELERTPMVVVCAGAKSILDLPATREALETRGVLVVGWRTDEMPGFYTAGTGLPVDVRVEGAEEVAALWRAHRGLEQRGALLLCVPPPPALALRGEEAERALQEALAGAERAGLRGKEVTPFLLRRMGELTRGRSLEANVALLVQNARIAARVAAAISG